ncbi:hypothetical protein SASPL_102243 [Salvia splendens]|uniref:Uncharacterized protein n=1 Tax=Salvia splendens TaxID=180675 RepID=A0A8X8YS79_SALSN|nr:hypothetical protein SASPL_102243 [Salvia splendens]
MAIVADPCAVVGAVQQQGPVALLRGGDLAVVVGRARAAVVASGREQVVDVWGYGGLGMWGAGAGSGFGAALAAGQYIECSMSSLVMKKKTTPGLRSFGSRCEPDYKVSVGMREQEGDGMSDSSSLDEQIAYSCVEARVFDCVCDCGMSEEELCDSENSILEKAAEKLMDRGFPSKNRGSREVLS